jgi:4-hydroxy-tetrahydrodipicolinate synthase
MLSAANLSGAYTALVTPFTSDGTSIDLQALESLVESQIQAGIAGIVPCGTTGEAPTLTEAELSVVIQKTVQVAKGRVPVLAGTGSFSTKKTVASSHAALEAGADGLMIVMPYYSKPSQAGLVEHICEIAAAVKAPVVLYNIPGRTGVDLGAEATAAIAERAPNVIGIKDATGHVLRCQELVRSLGDRLSVLCGDDALTLPMMACGARGVISVASNLLPDKVSDVCRLLAAGKYPEGRRAHLALLPLFEALFAEPSPAPVKAALAAKGKMHETVRPPLVVASGELKTRLARELSRYEAGA